jgi:hypothetical protein
MKKSVVFLMVIMIVAFAATISAQRFTLGPDIRVSLLNQEPDPAEPGRYVDVRFKLSNNGSSVADNVVFEVLPSFPFSIEPGMSSVETISSLYATGHDREALTLRFRLRVADNAIEGENELNVRYRFDGGDWIEPDPFLISVRTEDAVISIDSVSTGNADLGPGSKGTLKIKVTNTADSAIKNVKAVVDFGNGNFVTLNSINEKTIYNLGPRQSHEFAFDMLVNPQTVSGVYQVPLMISYSDSLGNTFTRNGTAGIIVNAKPDISVTLDATEVYTSGGSGEITLKLVNKGVTDLKFMNMVLGSGPDFRVLSNREAYLGNIDSDDFETASYRVHVSGSGSEVTLPVVLEFKDANNNEYTENVEVKVPLYSPSEAKRLGLVAQGGGSMWIVILVLLVIGFFVYRRYRKNRRK